MNVKISNRGFTLIETLFVLSILLIISFITVFNVKTHYESKECEAFLNQLQADYYLGQQSAISLQQEVSVFISSDNHYYYLRTNYLSSPIAYRTYSNNISVLPASLPLSFIFSSSGTVNKFGSFFIHCGSKHYRFTVLIGKGRFYVVEE